MKIIHKFNSSQDSAKQKVEDNFEALISRLPNEIEIKEIKRSWDGYELDFSFTAQKSFFRLPISGKIRVDEENLIFQADLPALVPEDMVREVIRKNLEDIF